MAQYQQMAQLAQQGGQAAQTLANTPLNDNNSALNQLLGIPQKYQNKSRFIQSSHYVVDYDAIFAESGGQLKDYWELPLEIDRNLDDVPSKKRSMYRKRYAMLDDLAKLIEEKLGL